MNIDLFGFGGSHVDLRTTIMNTAKLKLFIAIAAAALWLPLSACSHGGGGPGAPPPGPAGVMPGTSANSGDVGSYTWVGNLTVQNTQQFKQMLLRTHLCFGDDCLAPRPFFRLRISTEKWGGLLPGAVEVKIS